MAKGFVMGALLLALWPALASAQPVEPLRPATSSSTAASNAPEGPKDEPRTEEARAAEEKAETATTAGATETSTKALTPEIEDVQIVGDTDLDTDDVKEGLANRPPSGFIFKSRARLEPLALDLDRLRIESFYREKGYFTVKVEKPQVKQGEEGRVIVVFRVIEGPVSTVERIDVEGVPPEAKLDTVDLFAKAGLSTGTPFLYPEYTKAKDALREALFERGWARTRVEGRVEVAKAVASVLVRFKVDAGPPVRFGKAKVSGKTDVPEDAILARVAWTEGQRFTPTLLKETERRIYELSLVGSVRFELEGDGEVADVCIYVADASHHELRLGGGIEISSARYGIRGRGGYVQRKLFGPLDTFRAELKPGLAILKSDGSLGPEVEATAEFQRDDFLVPRLILSTGASYTAYKYEVYSTTGPSIFAGIKRPIFTDRLTLAVRLEGQVAAIFTDIPVKEGYTYGIADPYALAYVAPSITYDGRDDPMSPRRGWFARAEVEAGHLFTGLTTTYLKVTPELRGYLPIWTPRLVLAARLRAGATLETDYVPITQRYFSGGSESHRGFGRRQLSPTIRVGDAKLGTAREACKLLGVPCPDLEKRPREEQKVLEDCDRASKNCSPADFGPVGGEYLVEGSLELRWDAFALFGYRVGFVAFIDAGDVSLDLASLLVSPDCKGSCAPINPHVAVGPGIRYQTPIGPLRVDLGFRLNRRGLNEPAPDAGIFVFHLSLGEAF